MSDAKNPERIAAGLKATIHNPRTSEDAKSKAAQGLDEMGVQIEEQGSTHNAEKKTGRTGEFKRENYTAVDLTDNVDEADVDTRVNVGLDEGEHRLERVDYSGMQAENYVDDDDPETFDNIGRSAGADGGQPGEQRSMGGYRATLKNPRVSKQAKQHAQEVLEENDQPLSTR